MEPIRDWCLTEDPTLYGLVTGERGHLVEFISFQEASRRLTLAASRRAPLAADAVGGEPERK